MQRAYSNGRCPMMKVLDGEFSNLQKDVNFDYTPEGGGPRRMSVSRSTIKIAGGSAVSPLVLRDDSFTWDQNFITQAFFPEKESQELNPTNWRTIRGTDYQSTIVVGVMLARLKYERRQELDSQGRAVKVPGSYVDYVVSFAPNQIYDSRLQRWSNHTGKQGGQVHAEIFLASLLRAFIEQLKGGTEEYTRKDKEQPQKWIKEDCTALSAGLLTLEGYISFHSEEVQQSMCPACESTWKKLTKEYTYTKKVGSKEQKFESTFALF
jgi:hypothetical protein